MLADSVTHPPARKLDASCGYRATGGRSGAKPKPKPRARTLRTPFRMAALRLAMAPGASGAFLARAGEREQERGEVLQIHVAVVVGVKVGGWGRDQRVLVPRDLVVKR